MSNENGNTEWTWREAIKDGVIALSQQDDEETEWQTGP